MNKKQLKKKLKKFEPIKERYVFSDYRHPEKGIMSAILGCLSVGTFAAAVLFTYRNGGQALVKYAAAAIVAAVFSVAGLILGIVAATEKNIFHFFPNLGIVLNSIGIVFTALILVLGSI